MQYVKILAWFLADLTVYFLPSIIASARKHPRLKSIMIINLWAGFTLVGWIIALLWSFSSISALVPEEYETKAN